MPLTLSNIREFSHYESLNQNFIAERTVPLVLLSDFILFTARHIQISWLNSLYKHRMHRTFISLRRPSMLEHDLGENSVYGSFPHNDELVLQRESFHWYIFSCLRSRVFPSAVCDESSLLSHIMSCLSLRPTWCSLPQRNFNPLRIQIHSRSQHPWGYYQLT